MTKTSIFDKYFYFSQNFLFFLKISIGKNTNIDQKFRFFDQTKISSGYKDGDCKPEFEAKGLETVRRDGTLATSKILKHTATTLFDMTLCGEVNLAKLKQIVLAELTKTPFFNRARTSEHN